MAEAGGVFEIKAVTNQRVDQLQQLDDERAVTPHAARIAAEEAGSGRQSRRHRRAKQHLLRTGIGVGASADSGGTARV